VRKSVILLILILPLASGCATYLKSRANDFADCFTIGAGLNYGIGVHVQATNYVISSAGFWVRTDQNQIGYFGREPFYSAHQTAHICGGVPFTQIFTLMVLPSRDYKWYRCVAGLFCTDYMVEMERGVPVRREGILGINASEFGVSIYPTSDNPKPLTHKAPFIREKFFFEVEVVAGCVGFDAGFNPAEFVDFLLGWTTLDITGDDAEETPKR
jgi:hypothetical protein